MSRPTRFQCIAIALLYLLLWPLSPVVAQTVTYKYGFCLGIAGTPPVNQVTRAFALGPVGSDLRAEFMQELGKKYGSNVRRDATGCRMFATSPEAEKAHDQVVDQIRARPFAELEWLPNGSSALSKAGSSADTKPPMTDSSTPHSPR